VARILSRGHRGPGTAALARAGAAGGALLLALLLAAAQAPEVGPSAPHLELRADHMVVDAALQGSRVLAGTQSGRVDVFDWRTGEALGPLLALQPQQGQAFAPTIRCVTVSPSGDTCAVGASDAAVRVLDLRPAAAPRLRQTLAVTDPTACRFLDERRLLLGNMRGELALLELETGREIFRRQLEYDPVYALALSPDGARLAVALRSSRLHIVEPESGAALQRLAGHRDSVYALSWLGPRRLASAGKDKTILVWDLDAAAPQPRELYRGDRYVTALAAGPGARRLAFSMEGSKVGVLSVTDGHIARVFESHTAPVQVLLFAAPDRLVSAGNDARIMVWDLARKREGKP
jgi:WD40 repeat protein